MEPPRQFPEGATSIENRSSTDLKQDTLNRPVESTDDVEKVVKTGNSPKKVDPDEPSRPLEDRAFASSADALDSGTDSGLQANSEAKVRDPLRNASYFDDTTTFEPEGKSGINDCAVSHDSESSVDARTKEQNNSTTHLLESSSAHEHDSENAKDSGAYLTSMEDVGHIEEAEEGDSDQSADHPVNDCEPELCIKDRDVTRKKSDIELEYDMVDPLEVARQVAIEVERDCREQSCSSSDKAPKVESQQADSPDSADETQSHVREDLSKEVTRGVDLSAEGSALGEEPDSSAESPDTEPINVTQEIESSQVTEVAQELPADTEKALCSFDLNEEVYSDDADRPENLISVPIPVVSASRAPATSGLPVAPLQFEGTLGWKGSAATSAFRPASPRRIPEADKAHSIGGSSSSSKHRDGCLGFDLNVDESADEKNADPPAGKRNHVSSGLPSGESSVEASPRRSERLELDLNRVTDDGDTPMDWRRDFHQRNGYHSRSPSSSSSSKQPSLRNINLNDQPSFTNESSDHPYFIKLPQNPPDANKSNDSVISIMGMKVEVNRKDFIPQSVPFLNGRNPEPALDVNLTRGGGLLGIGSAVPYGTSPVYGYSGLTPGTAVALPSGMYAPGGPFPYMLDSRGAPVIPQVMSSASALPPAFSQQPFMMSMAGMPSSNGVGPLRNSFDLNSGLVLEGGPRDNGGLRQFLSPGQARQMDDHLKSNLQPSTSSGVGVKRKEPDSGWEAFPFKHHPSWK